ncbi:hypothetical protein MP878_12540 [Escherichia coli]|nr:hypothetical protein [Escherichia coli]
MAFSHAANGVAEM